MLDLIMYILSLGSVAALIKKIKSEASKPGGIKRLIVLLLIVLLFFLPLFQYLGNNIDISVAKNFFAPIIIGVYLFIDWLLSYVNRYSSFRVEVKVRVIGSEDKEFKYAVNAKIGDTVEFQLQYVNTSINSHKQVVVRDVLPKSLQYIKGTTKLYNTDYPNGAVAKQDTITTDGVNIRNYAAGANAIVRFRAKVVDDTMACGANALVNWGQVQAGVEGNKYIRQDKATVYTTKVCKNTDPEPTTSEDIKATLES